MMKNDRGMTLIEVSLALVILLLGVGYILKSDVVTHRYQQDRQLRQQMLFYAAGQMEAVIEGKEKDTRVDEALSPFKDFEVTIRQERISPENSQEEVVLEKVTVRVFRKDSPTKPEPVELVSYRVRVSEEKKP